MTMKFSIPQETFLQAIAAVLRATATRVIQPILAHIHLETVGMDQLRLSATDMDFSIQTVIPAMVEIPGKTTIHAKKLNDMVSKLPRETLNLQADPVTQTARLQCGVSVFDIRTLPAEEFPMIKQIDTEQTVAVNLPIFYRAIQHTVFAAASQETNNVLGGVYFKLTGEHLEMAATDGSRLARSVEALDGSTLEEPVSAIIPAKTLQELTKLLSGIADPSLTIALKDGQISFRTASLYVLSRLLDGQYPQYEQLIPKEFKITAYTNRHALMNALDRASVIADGRTNIVKMTFDQGNLSLTAQTPDIGDFKDSVTAQYDGEPLNIAFNYKFVLDALRVIESDDVRMDMNGGLTPTLFKARDENGYLCLVMPVQVK
jgi:DNA polymerase-3 subunit beta